MCFEINIVHSLSFCTAIRLVLRDRSVGIRFQHSVLELFVFVNQLLYSVWETSLSFIRLVSSARLTFRRESYNFT